MRHARSGVGQAVGIDRQRVHVPVLDQLATSLSRIGLVEGAVGVHAVLAILELRVSNDVRRVVMTVLPHKRDGGSVVVTEGVAANDPTV